MGGYQPEKVMKPLAAILALAAFAVASHQDSKDAELIHSPQVLACVHCTGER